MDGVLAQGATQASDQRLERGGGLGGEGVGVRPHLVDEGFHRDGGVTVRMHRQRGEEGAQAGASHRYGFPLRTPRLRNPQHQIPHPPIVPEPP
ncbi:hypothetical protein GCM10027091_01490 [Streptomyces daliensis]